MNKIILILVLFSFSTQAMAGDLKDVGCQIETQAYKLASQMAGISEEQCMANHADDKFYDGFLGCMTGHKKTGKAIVDNIAATGAFFKLLISEIPSAYWDAHLKVVVGILNFSVDPAKTVAQIADKNVAMHEATWEKAKEYLELFKKFMAEFLKELKQNAKGFFCKSMKEQHEIMCRAADEIFLLFLGPGAFIKGAKWGANITKAIIEFLDVLKLRKADGDIASRLRSVSALVKADAAKSGVRDVIRLRNATVREVTLPDGEKVLRYFKKVKGSDGKMHEVVREVTLDTTTKSIDLNKGIGKEIFEELVSGNQGKGSLMFIDINNLKRTNHFAGGHQTGDLYLEQSAESIRKALRPGDMLFRKGGDELVVIIANNNPEVVKGIAQRMINEVDRNPQIRQMFRNPVAALANKYKEVNRAGNFEDLSAAAKDGLSSAEQNLARSNFPEFKKQKLSEIQKAFTEQAGYRGSISVGSALIRPTDKVTEVLQRADAQASKVKATYKNRYGVGESKYGFDKLDESAVINRRGPPVPLDPD